MKCADVRAMAESYLAGELPVDTNHAMVAHLEQCASCRTELETRQVLRQTLRHAFLTSSDLAPDPGFMIRLRESVRRPQRVARRRLIVPPRWFAMAAGVALLALAGWQLARVNRVQPVERLAAVVAHAAGDHRYCALEHALEEPPISLEEAARRYGPVYASLQEVVAESSPVRGGELELLGAHWCVFKGRRFAHIVVRRRDHLVSILLTAIEPARAPGSADVTAFPATGGFQVAGFAAKGHAGFVVSDLTDGENLALAHELAPVLQKYFARA
jgi:anti-sigma factor RsiW